MSDSHLIGVCRGKEVYARNDGMYFIRVKADESDTGGTVHDLHKRIPVGRFDNFKDAMSAIDIKLRGMK